MRLSGKVAVVTGGGAGIGEAASLAMAAEAATVAIGDIAPETAEETVSAISAAGGEGWSMRLDVRDGESVAAFVRDVLARFGRIDVLVNNVGGIVGAASVVDGSEKDWDATFTQNVKGTYLMSRAVIPGMVRQRSGSVVNLGSAAGLAARRNLSAYSAAKGAIIALTRAMAADFGLDGVRVNCICPGPTMTTAFRRTLAASPDPEGLVRRRESEQLLGRLGEPADIANAIVFLASDAAAWITGQVFPVDGGNTAGQGLPRPGSG